MLQVLAGLVIAVVVEALDGGAGPIRAWADITYTYKLRRATEALFALAVD